MSKRILEMIFNEEPHHELFLKDAIKSKDVNIFLSFRMRDEDRERFIICSSKCLIIFQNSLSRVNIHSTTKIGRAS
jgi:hypothetical protein